MIFSDSVLVTTVPTWMDVDGGMQVDVYDSMAKAVSNAAVVICFMTQRYRE